MVWDELRTMLKDLHKNCGVELILRKKKQELKTMRKDYEKMKVELKRITEEEIKEQFGKEDFREGLGVELKLQSVKRIWIISRPNGKICTRILK